MSTSQQPQQTTKVQQDKKRVLFLMSKPYRIVVLGDGACGKNSFCNQFCTKQPPNPSIYNPSIERSYFTLYNLSQTSRVYGYKVSLVTLLINLTSCSGASDYQHLETEWIQNNESIILMYDVTSRDSFLRLLSLRKLVLQSMGIETDIAKREQIRRNNPELPLNDPTNAEEAHLFFKKSVVLVGNKVDVANGEDSKNTRKRQVTFMEGKRFAQKFFDFTTPAPVDDTQSPYSHVPAPSEEMCDGIPFFEISNKNFDQVQQVMERVIIDTIYLREHNQHVLEWRKVKETDG